MTTLSNWLSPEIMHALGWALIHSLWQCAGLAALAAILMALSRRPSIRYLIATASLVAMLAAPTATFLILMKPPAPAHVLFRANPGILSASAGVHPPAAAPMTAHAVSATDKGSAIVPTALPRQSFSARFLAPELLAPGLVAPNILPWLVGAWLWGVALFSLRFAGGFLLLEHRRRSQSAIPGVRVLALCDELQRRLGLTRAVRYLECGWLQTPAVVGWIRPIILLPVSALTGLSESQLRMVIAHELAHIRRLDAFVNLLQILVEALLFYHPAIWWLNRRIRTERELCCDEIAVSLTGDWLEYVKALMLMEEWEQAPALAMAANRGPLSQRVFHILRRKPFGAGQRLLGLTGAVLFLAAALGAANALFGIAYPTAMAEARTVARIVPIISRAATDQVASLASQAAAPVTKSTAADQSPGDTLSRRDAVQTETPAAPLPDAPQPSPDISPPPSAEASAAPEQTAPSDPAPAPTNAPPPVAVALNDPPAASRTCALPAIADTVGLNPVSGSNLMTVPVEINGKAKQFLLDLGTNPTAVSQAAVAELGLPENTRMTSVIQTGGTGGTADMGVQQGLQMRTPVYDVRGNQKAYGLRSRVRVGSFTIGTASAPNMMFMIATGGELAKGAPYDGILTNDIFRQYDAELDFAARQITFLTPAKCTDPDQVVFWSHDEVGVIPMTLVDGRIQVPVTIEGHPVDAIIDTSSPRSVMRRDIAERMLGYQAGTPEMMADGETKDGMDQPVFVHTFSRISFAGGVTAVNVPALIQTNSMLHDKDSEPVLGSRASSVDPRIPDLTLGMDVLRQLHVYAVFGQKKLYVTANK